MNGIIVGENNIYYEVDDDRYLAVSKMGNVYLYESPDANAMIINAKRIVPSEFMEVLKEGSTEDQLDFLYNNFADVARIEVPDEILEIFASVLFDTRVICSVGISGPYINFGTCIAMLGESGTVVLKDAKTGGDIGKPFKANIYTTVQSSTVPRDVVRSVMTTLLRSTDEFKYQKYMVYTSVMDEFADYIKVVAETPIDTEKEAVFNRTFIPETTPMGDISVVFRDGNLEINNNGKIVVIEGGDGIALSTKDGVLTVSTKGLKKEAINSKTFEEAMSKVAAKTLEVLRPCGSKAMGLYVSKIKPEISKLTKEVVSQSGAVFNEGTSLGKSFSEKRTSEKEGAANTRSFSKKSAGVDRDEEYYEKSTPQKIKMSEKMPSSQSQGGNKESPGVLYAGIGIMILVIILVAFS